KQTVGALSIELEARYSMGLANSPMHGADIKVSRGNFITARPLGVIEGVDYAHTGVVRKVNAAAIHQHVDKNNIVLISNLGYSPTGEVLNLATVVIASGVVIVRGTVVCILFVSQRGVKKVASNLVSSLSPVGAEHLILDIDDCMEQALVEVRE